MNAGALTSGRLWGRTGCGFDATQNRWRCKTGDCDGAQVCSSHVHGMHAREAVHVRQCVRAALHVVVRGAFILAGLHSIWHQPCYSV